MHYCSTFILVAANISYEILFTIVLTLTALLWSIIKKSLTIPSSVVAEEDKGGEGVEERNDEAPELESTDGGRSGFVMKFGAEVDGINP